MTTSGPGKAAPCLLLVLAPRCGEAARERVRREGITAARLRPGARPVRARTAILALPSAPPRRLLEELLAPCTGLVELVEGGCVEKQRPPPPGASYVIIGSVAVVSESDSIKGREKEVAEAILRAHPGLEAVYVKEETVGEHRVQRLRLIAGRPVEETIYVEHGIRYLVRPGRVYVNPRLATEHARIAAMVELGERVLDMFAGFGGFSLLIASTGKPEVIVANDINPYAVEAMVRSIVLNPGRVRSPLLVLQRDAAELPRLLRPTFTRIIMNLPHGARGFLPAALKLCDPARGCVIHLYTVAASPEEAARGLGLPILGVTRVLDYAPRRFIYRVDLLAPGEREEEGHAAPRRRGEY